VANSCTWSKTRTPSTGQIIRTSSRPVGPRFSLTMASGGGTRGDGNGYTDRLRLQLSRTPGFDYLCLWLKIFASWEFGNYVSVGACGVVPACLPPLHQMPSRCSSSPEQLGAVFGFLVHFWCFCLRTAWVGGRNRGDNRSFAAVFS
jgi:hypothetical protein